MNPTHRFLSSGLLLALVIAAAALAVFTFVTHPPQPAAAAPAVAPAAQATPSAPGSITVSGNAQVLVPPDEVVLTLGVETSDMNIDVAKRQNDEIIKRVLDLTTQYGIEPKHVQTDYVNIQPRYNDYPNKNTFIGYYVRKTVEIRLGDISKFEGLYSDVLKAGVNCVQGVDFRTTQLRKYRDQARALAIQAAQEKATALAGALAGGVGQATGKVKLIREDSSNWYGSYNSWWRGSAGMIQNVVQNEGGAQFTQEGTLAPGQISVEASVTVEFELVDK